MRALFERVKRIRRLAYTLRFKQISRKERNSLVVEVSTPDARTQNTQINLLAVNRVKGLSLALEAHLRYSLLVCQTFLENPRKTSNKLMQDWNDFTHLECQMSIKEY